MNKIEQWYTNGQDFDDGFNLLFTYNPHHALEFKVWCSRNFVPQTYRQQLRIAIDKLDIGDLGLEIGTPISNPKQPTTNHQQPTTKTEPSIISQYRKLWYENSNNYRRVHALLSSAVTNETRAEHATMIMTDIIPERTRISEVLEAYEKHGTLPISMQLPTPEGRISELPSGVGGYTQGLRDGAAQMQRITNLTSRINKIQNQLLPNAKRENNAERIDFLEKEHLAKTAEIITIKQSLGLSKTPEKILILK